MKIDYGLHIPKAVERRIGRCRAAVQSAIRTRLQELVVAATKGRTRLERALAKAPPLRFYIYEGYRISYRIDPVTRRVVVLGLLAEAP
jgi:hypothetical protein